MGETTVQAACMSEGLTAAHEREILTRCRAGDWSDFGLIVARYRRLAWAAADAVLSGEAGIDDVVQEAFIRVYEKLHTYRGESSFSSWLYRLARNQAISHLRKVARRPRQSSLDDTESGRAMAERLADGDRPDAGYHNEARRQVLNMMVGRLPREYRDVVNLYYTSELSYEDIAKVLRLPLNTVKTRLRRARLRLSQSAREAGWH
jgi:RNA polymerase sigma-70 factor (ECF subfamily)